MKKTILTLLLTLAFGSVSKFASAVLPPSIGNGVAVVAVAVFGLDSAASKDAKAPSKLEGEFAALNSSTDSAKLKQQSAGGSANLKALLK